MLGALCFGGCAPRSDLNRAMVLVLTGCVEMSRALETSSEGILHSQLLVCFPSSPQQTNCIDRQKQDYGEEICKTTGLRKLKQANTEIMFGVWVVGAGGGQGQGGSSSRAVRRWWRGSRGGVEMFEEKSEVTSPCKLLWTETNRSALRLLILVLGSARTKR